MQRQSEAAWLSNSWVSRICCEKMSMSDRVIRMNSAEIFTQFVIAINHHDIEALTALMTTDHLFVDSMGNRVHSATSMKVGWLGYFAMCPDYWIHTDEVMAKDSVVLAVGEAGGTIDGVAYTRGLEGSDS
jgi:ketosteroid isomerase-like protein